jgi:hypothetical protein
MRELIKRAIAWCNTNGYWLTDIRDGHVYYRESLMERTVLCKPLNELS